MGVTTRSVKFWLIQERFPGTPVRGGTYRFAITGDWGTINPLTSVAFGQVAIR